ncbi:hypothetical protein IJ541_06275 [bacterium]|nr:hypothetical protein [bacterium]
MEKTVHVNAYVKKDGTQVREHFRTIDSNIQTPPIFSENKIPALTDESQYKFDSQHSKKQNLLEATISKTVFNDTIGNNANQAENIFEKIIDIGATILPIAVEIYSVANSGDQEVIAGLQPQIQNRIRQLDIQMNNMKQYIDITSQKLAMTNDKNEYSRLYKPFIKTYNAYQQAQDLVNRIKIHANNGNYKDIINEFNNYQHMNNIISNSEEIKNEINKMVKVANYSDGPLSIANNYLNYDRPEAKQFMNLALKIPEDTSQTKDFSMIKPIFNLKFNKFLNSKGTTLQIPKNMKGIVFNETSSISQKLSNFKPLQNDIRAEFIKNPSAKYLTSLGIDSDTNLQYSVGHFTIINPKIENGYFKGELLDIYDFNWLKFELAKDIYTYSFNNFAYILQILKRIKNYYFLIPIKFKW